MSVDAYKIAVQIALTENVTRGLAMMSPKFQGVNRDAKELAKELKDLERRLASIGKMTMLGGGLVAAGGAGLKLLEEPLKKAMDYERYVANLRQQGLGNSQIDDAKKYVQATNIINTSALDRMRIFTEAQGAFRESGKSGAEALEAAKTMLPVLSTYEVALSTLSGSKHAAAEGAMRNLNKTVEIMGGIGNMERAKEIADGVFKATQSSGKMVDERQLKQFFAYGASSTNQQSLRTVFGGLEPIIGELGGSTVAVGMRTAYSRTNGMMSLPPKLMLHEMQRLGMVDSTGRKQNAMLADLQSTNVIGYAQEIMQRYAKAGIVSQTDRERENAIIFGTNGSKVFNKIMSQLPVLKESLEAYDKAQGASQVTNDPANKALMARQNFQKKWEDLQLVLGQNGGLIDMATKGLTALGSAISSITVFARQHPLLTKIAVGGFAVISMLAIFSGTLLLVRGALMGLKILYEFKALGPILKLAISPIILGFKILGRMLLLNPIGLAVTAIAAAAYLLWNNWTEISASLKVMWGGIKTGFVKLFHGDVLGAWYSFSGAYLKGWQTVLNTLIAGLNTILPKALELQKMTFGDDYARSYSSSNTIRTAPTPAQGNQVADVYLDGDKVGNLLSRKMGNKLNKGLGSGFFDAGLSLPPTALNR